MDRTEIRAEPIAVYVPTLDRIIAALVPKSGMVGSPADEWFDAEERGGIIVDFEGAKYGQSNIITFADKCAIATGRHREHYPTVARMLLKDEWVERVATFYPEASDHTHRGVVVPDSNDGAWALARWLMIRDLADIDQELRVSREYAPRLYAP